LPIPKSGEAKSLPINPEKPEKLTTADAEEEDAEEEDGNLDEQAIPITPAPEPKLDLDMKNVPDAEPALPGGAAGEAMKAAEIDTKMPPAPINQPIGGTPPAAPKTEEPEKPEPPPPAEIGEGLGSVKSYQDRIFEEKFKKLKQAFAKQ